MTNPKKLIGAGVLILAAVLCLYWLPLKQRPSIKLPDGSTLKFDAVGIGKDVFFYDGGLRMAVRRYLPAKWCSWMGIGQISSLKLSESGLPDGFSELGLLLGGNMNGTFLQTSLGTIFVQLVDENRSFISDRITMLRLRSEGRVGVSFENSSWLSDEILLKLISIDKQNTNQWMVLGEIRFKNPIPKDKRS